MLALKKVMKNATTHYFFNNANDNDNESLFKKMYQVSFQKKNGNELLSYKVTFPTPKIIYDVIRDKKAGEKKVILYYFHKERERESKLFKLLIELSKLCLSYL